MNKIYIALGLLIVAPFVGYWATITHHYADPVALGVAWVLGILGLLVSAIQYD